MAARLAGRIKVNRMFFFANFEGIRQNESQSKIRVVPNALARQGIIPLVPAGALAAGCVVATIPGTRTAAWAPRTRPTSGG